MTWQETTLRTSQGPSDQSQAVSTSVHFPYIFDQMAHVLEQGTCAGYTQAHGSPGVVSRTVACATT
jgi:hypothetical protein